MNTERQRLAEDVFNGAVACDASIRDAFVRSRCGHDSELLAEVLSLLKFIEDGDGPLDASTPPLAYALSQPESPHDALPAGTRIGAYTITRPLGFGGMGVVYLAEQERPRRTVALKLIRPGIATPSVLRRFEFEAEVLGRLQHPGIAQIIEAGTADTGLGAQPFFAMEFVDGIPLNDFFRERSLTQRDKLEMLLKICDAVDHAHRRGIIHRDLKPGNILVASDGQPKVLDFGIARAAGAHAAEQRLTLQSPDGRQLVGTLLYMSPEQVAAGPEEIDSRSDVFALGVILYELLAGRTPLNFDGVSLPVAVRAICEKEPPRLGTIVPACKGDIETIVAKSLEKDRLRRYQSASDFAADIRRYLEDAPITARPPSTVYTLRKLAKRHKAFAAGIALAAASMTVGLISSTLAWRHARAERDRAVASAARSDQIAGFLKDMLTGVDPAVAKGRDTTLLQQILATSINDMAAKLKGQPDAEAELRVAVGSVYANLDLFDKADAMFRIALDLYARAPGDHREATAFTLRCLADVRLNLADLNQAETLAVQSSDLYRAIATTGESDGLAAALQVQARVKRERSDLVGAAKLQRESVAMNERTLPAQHPQVASGYNDLAKILSDLREFAEAEKYYKLALAMQESLAGRDDPTFLAMLHNYGVLLNFLNRQPEAESTLREVLNTRRRVLGAEHSDTAATMGSLANVCADQGRDNEAAELLLPQLEIRKKLLGEKHPSLATSYTNLGYVFATLKDYQGAEEAFRSALEIDRSNYGDAHRYVADDYAGLARVCRMRGDPESAIPLQRDAVATLEKAVPLDSPDLAGARALLADMLLEAFWKDFDRPPATAGTLRSRAEEAESLYRKSKEPRSHIKGRPWLPYTTDSQIGESLVARATQLLAPDRSAALALLTEAQPLCLSAFQGLETVVGEMPVAIRTESIRRAALRLARLYQAWQSVEPDPSRLQEVRRWHETATTYLPPDSQKPGA